jgi:hypothetical protein
MFRDVSMIDLKEVTERELSSLTPTLARKLVLAGMID